MGQYHVGSVPKGKKMYYMICSNDDSEIIKEPTKYLKHKVNQRRSPNTVRDAAFGIAYYMNYLHKVGMTEMQVLDMKYSEQHEHFVGFLHWLSKGYHCDRAKLPSNNTCNSYLKKVFGYYQFLLLEYDYAGDIKVLERRDITYGNQVGIRFKRSVDAFQGYLPSKSNKPEAIEKDTIQVLLDNTKNLRTCVMILLLAETGFRIGELLGVKLQDIDDEKRTIRVEFREDNANGARAKNAEYRHAKISEETYTYMQMYIAENVDLFKKPTYLFLTLNGKTRGEPLTKNAVYSEFRQLEKKTGIKVTPHQLRRYFANERRKAGWKIEHISVALGHRHILTTERYLNVQEDEVVEAMDGYYEANGGLYNIDRLL